VQPVVDSIMKHEYSLVGLTAVKDHDEYTYAHCVNVSVISVGIGQALGCPARFWPTWAWPDWCTTSASWRCRRRAAQTGQAERRRVAPDAAASARRREDDDAHAGLSMLTLDTMRVCLEHHMAYNRTGYPSVAGDWGQATLSRIVAVADCFDAISAHRAYHRKPRSAFEALEYMLGPTRVSFDPAALWGLVRTVGSIPREP
jgi:HD-GYP domain-containing protein (c-di-GMP phosphodiesterase class II)